MHSAPAPARWALLGLGLSLAVCAVHAHLGSSSGLSEAAAKPAAGAASAAGSAASAAASAAASGASANPKQAGLLKDIKFEHRYDDGYSRDDYSRDGYSRDRGYGYDELERMGDRFRDYRDEGLDMGRDIGRGIGRQVRREAGGLLDRVEDGIHHAGHKLDRLEDRFDDGLHEASHKLGRLGDRFEDGLRGDRRYGGRYGDERFGDRYADDRYYDERYGERYGDDRFGDRFSEGRYSDERYGDERHFRDGRHSSMSGLLRRARSRHGGHYSDHDGRSHVGRKMLAVLARDKDARDLVRAAGHTVSHLVDKAPKRVLSAGSRALSSH